MLIGITGKSGSGKSTLARYLADIRENTIYIDVDKIGHQVNDNENVKKELKKQFGEFIFKDGKVDRKRLGAIVFNSEEAMNLLKDITWSEMKKIIDNLIRENPKKDIVIDWALLPNCELFNECGITVLIDVPYEVRLARVQQRDNLTEEKFRQRESKSVDYDNYKFDFVIDNIDYEKAKEKVGRLI